MVWRAMQTIVAKQRTAGEACGGGRERWSVRPKGEKGDPKEKERESSLMGSVSGPGNLKKSIREDEVQTK